MNLQLVIDNFLTPPILFFFLGMVAVFFRSDLEIPSPLPRLFSLYLLFSIGFKGGVELSHSGIGREVVEVLLAGTVMALVVPVYTFFLMRKKLGVYDAAAIAATYGSVSAVTFITAVALLQTLGIPFGGHMVAAMALMESPAIIIGVLLVGIYAKGREEALSWPRLLHEAFLSGSVVLLLGSLLIGLATGNRGAEALGPFYNDIFKGMLSFFLLDMGIVAARRMGDLVRSGALVLSFCLLIPLVNAGLGLAISRLLGLSEGDALLFTVLCASASYIAVPAAMRMAVPEANPSLYVPMSLAITFPFNILLGIPLYLYLIRAIWP